MKPKHREHGLGGLLMKAIRLIRPIDASEAARLNSAHWSDLREEFKVHQAIAELICIAGLLIGIIIPVLVDPPIRVWDIGIGFGAMVGLPMIYMMLICRQKGLRAAYERLTEYWTMKYAIPGTIRIWFLYTPIALVGCVCLLLRCVLPIRLN